MRLSAIFGNIGDTNVLYEFKAAVIITSRVFNLNSIHNYKRKDLV